MTVRWNKVKNRRSRVLSTVIWDRSDRSDISSYWPTGHFRVLKTSFQKIILNNICIRIKESFSYRRLCTQPRFETEALGNSEMAKIFPWPYNNPRSLFESQLTRPSFPLVSKLAMWEQPGSQGSLPPVIRGWCGSSFKFSQIVNKNSSPTWPSRIIPRSRSPRISSSTFVFANFWGIWVR